MTAENWFEVEEIRSNQEEADTRLILHALHASKTGSQAVIVTAEDTDVMIICLAFSRNIQCGLYQKCGTKNRTRFIDITKLSNFLGSDISEALIGLHAFTGCDTVSAFAGHGKLKALKLLKKNKDYMEIFSKLGESWELSVELSKKVEKFTCHLYSTTTSTPEVNTRYQLFCAKQGEVESSQLPPCRDCLHMHVLRANYQASIWRRSLQTYPDIPNPVGFGWTTDVDTGNLIIKWMSSPPAPDTVLELLSCKCQRSCVLPSCPCLNNGLECTNMCKLQTCSNQKKEDFS